MKHTNRIYLDSPPHRARMLFLSPIWLALVLIIIPLGLIAISLTFNLFGNIEPMYFYTLILLYTAVVLVFPPIIANTLILNRTFGNDRNTLRYMLCKMKNENIKEMKPLYFYTMRAVFLTVNTIRILLVILLLITVPGEHGIELQVKMTIMAGVIFIFNSLYNNVVNFLVRLRIGREIPSLIYLRPFMDDKISTFGSGSRWTNAMRWFSLSHLIHRRMITIETFLYYTCKRAAIPFPVAVGEAGQILPQLGFPRLYFDEKGWKAGVTELIVAARVIIISAGVTRSLEWELREISARSLSNNTIVLFLPGSETKHKYQLDNVRRNLAGFENIEEEQDKKFVTICSYISANGELTHIFARHDDRSAYYEALIPALYDKVCKRHS